MLSRRAEFSSDRLYRYTLEIQVAKKNHRMIQFIGLNPSTADEKLDDATMRRLKRFTADWGYGWFTMTNLFAYRTRDPYIMKTIGDPIGPLNNYWLKHVAENVDLIVCCWGNHGTWRGRDRVVLDFLKKFGYDLHCFGESRDGNPLHPLRLPASLSPTPYRR